MIFCRRLARDQFSAAGAALLQEHGRRPDVRDLRQEFPETGSENGHDLRRWLGDVVEGRK